MKSDLLAKLKEIKLFLFDLEGVLLPRDSSKTSESENEFLLQLKSACEEFWNHNVKLGIVTASNDKLIDKIKDNSKCILLSDSINKVKMVDDFLKHDTIEYNQVLYIGDDILDIPLLQRVGISGAPKDGRREVKRVVSFITKSGSGHILPEIMDYIKQTKK
jgi:YrbI family 3-deoxy-D-manno-octulosonate 8-phosphate phosphatase